MSNSSLDIANSFTLIDFKRNFNFLAIFFTYI